MAALVALSLVPVPAPSDYFCPGTFLFSCGSRPARCTTGKMAAPMSRGSRGADPGAAPYGNFPNYSRFHPPEGRVNLLPQGLLSSLFPAATRPLLGLDVGCNSGVRGRHGGAWRGRAGGNWGGTSLGYWGHWGTLGGPGVGYWGIP